MPERAALAGRFSTRASVRVNVRLVTGVGAAALKAPVARSLCTSHDTSAVQSST